MDNHIYWTNKSVNVKGKYTCPWLGDNFPSCWIVNSESFNKLESSRVAYGKGEELGRKCWQSLIQLLLFLLQIATSLQRIIFFRTPLTEYILLAGFSQDPLQKLFGKTRQCCGGSLYIGVVYLVAAGKV